MKITRYYLADENDDPVGLTEGYYFQESKRKTVLTIRLSRGKTVRIFATKEAIFKDVGNYITRCKNLDSSTLQDDQFVVKFKVNDRVVQVDEIIRVLLSCKVMRMEVAGTEPDKIDFNLDKIF